MTAGPNPPFQIGRFPRVDSQIRSILRSATKEGRKARVVRALADAIKRLENDPFEFGDPERSAVHPETMVYHGFSRRIFFHYVVFRREKMVMILDVGDMEALK